MPEILFEDPHLIIVNKPAGLLTQPDDTGRSSQELELKEWIKKRDNKPGNVFLEATHRIDRVASGIVVFAKRSKALARVQKAVRDKEFQKTYLALVEGTPTPDENTLEHYLVHDDFKARIANEDESGAKLARLTYRILEKRPGKTLLEIDLHTGRYHQIRAQLSAIGHPIIGDTKYGSKYPGKTIALHNYRLTLPHPMTGGPLSIEAPRPQMFI